MDTLSSKEIRASVHARKNLLYEIPHIEPLEKTRTECRDIHGHCFNETENPGPSRPQSFDGKGEVNLNEFCFRTVNKLSAEITHEIDEAAILRYIRDGILNFGVDLFYGSVQQNLGIVTRLREAILRESQAEGFPVPFSIYVRLSPRLPFTGGLRSNNQSFFLKPKSQVVLTSNRKYASRCSGGVIYVNAKFLLPDLQKCDILRVGDIIELQVAEIGVDKVTCTVIAAGEVTKRMPVRFPSKFDCAHLRVSAEELEDLTFAMETGINVIVAHTPDAQIQSALAELEFRNCFLFTRLTPGDLESYECSEIKRVIDDFDGFLLDCTEKDCDDEMLQLPKVVHEFFHQVFIRKKPIFLAGCWSMCVHPDDYEVAFFYPDKYILPCTADFLHLYEALSHKFALEKDESAHDDSMTIARSIAAASFEFNADAIIICSLSDKMAADIAHHRPETPIIAVTNEGDAINIGCMRYNTRMLLFDANKSLDTCDTEIVHQGIVYGVRYALRKELINFASIIILVYSKSTRLGSTDTFIVIKSCDDYVEVIRKAILDN